MRSVFFSYAREDTILVDVASQLVRATGLEVFVDTHSLKYGMDWRSQVEEAIASAHRMFLFWSSAATRSRWILFEIQVAHRHKTPVIPIVLDDSPLPIKLRHIHAVTGLATVLRDHAMNSTQVHTQAPTAAPYVALPPPKYIARARSPRAVLPYTPQTAVRAPFPAKDIDAFRMLLLGASAV